jgi:O-antigen/teichoic acid export membrane protein
MQRDLIDMLMKFFTAISIRGGATLLGLLLTVVLAKLMPPAEVGSFLFSIALLQWLGMITRGGVEHYIVKNFSVREKFEEYVDKYNACLYFVLINSAVIGFLCYFIMVFLGRDVLEVVLALPFFSFSVVCSFIFQSQHRINSYVFVRNMSWQIFILISVLCFHFLFPRVEWGMILFGFFLNTFVVLYIYRHYSSGVFLGFSKGLFSWYSVLKGSSVFFLTSIVSMTTQVGPIVFAGFVMSGTDLAAFSIYFKIAALQMMFVSIINSYFGPRLSEALFLNMPNKIRVLLKNSILLILFLILGFGSFWYFFGVQIVGRFYGDEYLLIFNDFWVVFAYQSFKSISSIFEYFNVLAGSAFQVGLVSASILALTTVVASNMAGSDFSYILVWYAVGSLFFNAVYSLVVLSRRYEYET